MEGALALLRRAVEIDPTYGHAHNEMAYVLGKKLRRLDEAEDAARRAVECDPQNPKFQNALMGVLTDRVSALGARKDILGAIEVRISELDKAIAENPAYPPYHLGKAAALASSGRAQAEWRAEIQKARELYARQTHAASGLPLGPGDVDAILARSTAECQELAKRWDSLPEE
jgi:tetratricopeptide (TPR) repeat protein